MSRPGESAPLRPLSFGSIHSYELRNHQIVGRFLGLLPFLRIDLDDVAFMRLATRSETPLPYRIIHWTRFLPGRRSRCPVYLLQLKTNRRVFIPLEGGAHFRLRQAIGGKQRRMAQLRKAA